MFGILNETILAISVLLTRWVSLLPALLRSRKSSPSPRGFILDSESVTQWIRNNELVCRLLSDWGIELRERAPVKVRTDQRYFKDR